MRKWIVLSAVSFMLTGTALVTTQTSYAHAEDHGQGQFHGQGHKDRQGPDDVHYYEKSTPTSSRDNAQNNMQQIVTQFEQAIEQYQKALSQTDNKSPKGNPFNSHNTTNVTTAPPVGSIENTTNENSTNSRDSTQPKKPHGTQQPAASRTHNNQKDTSSKEPTKEPKVNALDTTNAGQDKSGASSQGTTVSPLNRALQTYHTATVADNDAQQTFKDAVTAYMKSQERALNGHTTIATQFISNARQALTNLETALQNQDQIDQLITTLQTDEKQGNDSKLINDLHNMSQLETSKVTNLKQAASLLSTATTQIKQELS